MKKFLKFALKPQWKTVLLILVLVILLTGFQIEIINLFAAAIIDIKLYNPNYLFDDGVFMLTYTIISMILIYGISYLSTQVSSKEAYNTREKIFHILMNLPEDEISKFKITGLITRSTRGIYSEQGFIQQILEHYLIIPVVFLAVVAAIALIDRIFAGLFAALIIILTIILIFRLKQITEIYFKAKKTYGKINQLFFLKINNIADKISFNRQEAHNEFEKACEDSYQKNIRYLLSQYYLGPMLLLLFNVFILVLFTMMCYGYTFGFEFEDAINSVVIIQYIMYFITTLVVIPTLIERWPRAYASSVRLEEVLVLEDKITEKKNKNFKEIKIEKEDIYDLNKRILVDRKEIAINSIGY